MDETIVTKPKVKRFTKERIIAAPEFRHRQDALSIALEDGKTYSMDEAKKTLEKFMKLEVK